MNIAFDLDGTLITAREKQSCLLRAVASRYGLFVDHTKIWEKKRAGFSTLNALLDAGIDQTLSKTVAVAWQREIETPYWLSLDTIFPDTLASLHLLQQAGFKLTLITARTNNYLMRQQIYRLGIEKDFHSVFCVSPGNTIDEKCILLKKINAQGYFGDSETDYKAAQLADTKFFGVDTGQRSKEFLGKNGVVNIYSSLGHAVKSLIQHIN